MRNQTKLVFAATFTTATLSFALFAQQRAPAPARGAATHPRRQPQRSTAPREQETGRPDLNGLWQALDGPNWNLEPHAADFPSVPQLGAIKRDPTGNGRCRKRSDSIQAIGPRATSGEFQEPYRPGSRSEVLSARCATRKCTSRNRSRSSKARTTS
jgi:hypothetical protein